LVSGFAESPDKTFSFASGRFAKSGYQKLGDPQGAKYAALAKQKIADSPSKVNKGQIAFEAFQTADSPDEVRQAVKQFSLMKDPVFITMVNQLLEQNLPPVLRSEIAKRLEWLRQVLRDQEGKK
jgi:hypothetical protein